MQSGPAQGIARIELEGACSAQGARQFWQFVGFAIRHELEREEVKRAPPFAVLTVRAGFANLDEDLHEQQRLRPTREMKRRALRGGLEVYINVFGV
mmetsp:Transcript_7250/g.20418  ORF Transcript_7250/g.20418 Transcript_7250/m.20418 type:complete len:96 (-) Transcript_7250:356-643(-)